MVARCLTEEQRKASKERRLIRNREHMRERRGTPEANYRPGRPHTEAMTKEELRAYARHRHRMHKGIIGDDYRVRDGFNLTVAKRAEEKRQAAEAKAGALLMAAMEQGDEDAEDRAWQATLAIMRDDPLLKQLRKVHQHG